MTRHYRTAATTSEPVLSTRPATSGPRRACRMGSPRRSRCRFASRRGSPSGRSSGFARVELAGGRRYRRLLVVRPRAPYGRIDPPDRPLDEPRREPAGERGRRGLGTDQAALTRLAEDRHRADVAARRVPLSRAARARAACCASGTRVRRRSARIRPRWTFAFEPSPRCASADTPVVNGEEVTFRGRLKGGPFARHGQAGRNSRCTPAGGWLTFATPRADDATGLWSHRYRFAATRGRVRYRFRARVPKEASYPVRERHVASGRTCSFEACERNFAVAERMVRVGDDADAAATSTYANVMATVAVFIALGGTSYALTLPRNSVGAAQIRARAVRCVRVASTRRPLEAHTQPLGQASATSRCEPARPSRGSRARAGRSSRSARPRGAPYSVAVNSGGTVVSGNGESAASHAGTGIYSSSFDRDMTACRAVATLSRVPGGGTVTRPPGRSRLRRRRPA